MSVFVCLFVQIAPTKSFGKWSEMYLLMSSISNNPPLYFSELNTAHLRCLEVIRVPSSLKGRMRLISTLGWILKISTSFKLMALGIKLIINVQNQYATRLYTISTPHIVASFGSFDMSYQCPFSNSNTQLTNPTHSLLSIPPCIECVGLTNDVAPRASLPSRRCLPKAVPFQESTCLNWPLPCFHQAGIQEPWDSPFSFRFGLKNREFLFACVFVFWQLAHQKFFCLSHLFSCVNICYKFVSEIAPIHILVEGVHRGIDMHGDSHLA